MYRLSVILLIMVALSGSGAMAYPATSARPYRYFDRMTSTYFLANLPEGFFELFKGEEGYEVCLSTIDAFGCASVDEEMININKKLASATVAPAPINYIRCEGEKCTEHEGTVAFTFEGTGSFTRSQGRVTTSNGCTIMEGTKWRYREGAASMTFNGQSYSADNAFLTTSSRATRIRCRG